ncbi:MAG: GYD domain-containing protein [Acidobacteriota bacterium]
MATYMTQVTYTSEAWAAMVKHPQDRAEIVGKAMEKMGGRMLGFWWSFGEQDAFVVFEMPDEVSAAAFMIAIAAGGACSNVKTTAVLSPADAQKAVKKAKASAYRPVK